MKYFIITILSFIQLIAVAQPDIKNICKLEDNRLIFLLDVNWTPAERQEVSNTFDLDSLLLEKAFMDIPVLTYDSVEWKVKRINKQIIELSKDLSITSSDDVDTYSYMDLNEFIQNMINMVKNNSISYGVNDFKQETAFSYKDSMARFFLPGNKKAEKVYLSGSFNDWSTQLTPMHYQDSGWVTELKLPPNKYLYKYIVDGKWTHDPNNSLREKNEHNTKNSIVFCYNYIFKLNAHKDARNVFTTGSFNNWNKNELKMKQVETGWELPIFIKEGTHSYKFVVDNEWITDPDNPLIRDDGAGNKNSVLEIGEKYEFNLNGFQNADKVILTGNFNAWNTKELNMEKTTDGWKISYVFAPGVYEYKYIVDGSGMIDSTNQYTVGLDETMNSVLVVEPNYTFSLNQFQNAKKVCLTGSFNGWNPEGYTMKKEDGKWVFPIFLSRGKHLYKFIVDGEWVLDPDNSLWENNGYGTGNSILWMK